MDEKWNHSRPPRKFYFFPLLSPPPSQMQVAGQDGISKLLAAETDAQKIVSDARKGEDDSSWNIFIR